MGKQNLSNPPRGIEEIANEVISQQGDPVFGNAGFGASYDFAGKDVDRYISYGTNTYGKLGYDPFRDNSNFYNQNTSANQDLQRAFTGMWKLAGVGFRDTFAFGATAGKEAHKEFDQVMSTYGSTRKGTAGFVSNTMLSSGYTVGIMGAIAAEELLLAGATALTGGIAAPLTVGAMGATAARGASNLNRAQQLVKGFDKVADVLDYTKNIENARLLWAAKQSQSFFKKLAPLGETFDFIRTADKMKDLNGLQKSLQGVGAFARDARKIHMTNAESKLEANLAKDEFREELIREWNADPMNIGRTMDSEKLDEINDRANTVFKNTYNGNAALIYATNAITFDVMFKSARMTNRMFGLHESLKYTVGKQVGGKIAVNALEDTFQNYLKKQVSSLTWKGTAKKTLQASVEGFQEVGQDFISGTAKRYSGTNPKLEGNIWDSMYDALGDMHGESFLSGMLMGTFASPVAKTIQAVNQVTVGGGYKAIFDSEAYQANKESLYQDAIKKAEVLTDFFNESGSFSDLASRPIFAQSLSAEQMMEAGEQGDRKTFEDKRAESFRLGLKTLLDSNMETELLDYLSDLGNYTAEELNQAMGRTDITEDNKSEFMQRVENYSSKIKDFKSQYDEIQREFVNPVSIRSLDGKDPQFLEKKLLHRSYEMFKDELLFSQDRIKELAERQKSLYDGITNEKFTTTALNTILTQEALASEIESLKLEVTSDKEYGMTTEQTKFKEAQIEALNRMAVSLKKYNALTTDVEDTERVYQEMFEDFNDYTNSFTGQSNTPGNRVANKKKFQQYWDYMNLKGESDVLQEHVNTMNDPSSSFAHVERIRKRLQRQEENKKSLIEDSLKAFYNKKASDEMIADLLEQDMVFDHNELDDLIERSIMPRKLFNLTTHAELKGEDLKLAQAIIAKHYKDLTGKTIIASDKGYATRTKSSRDKRTSSELVSQYSSGVNKAGTVESFVQKLVRSKAIGNTEREILKTLVGTGGLKGRNIILTDSGETPIDINDKGDIVIDVRFSSEDYNEGTISFEYLGVSALLQTYFTEQLESNPELKATITSLMNDAKEAVLEREGEKLNRATANNIPVFKNPAVFLSESLNNSAFQDILKNVENTSTAEDNNLWDSLRDLVSENLNDKFEGSLLNRALDLAYLTLTDEAIEVSDEKVTPVSTAKEGELSDVQRTENQIGELDSKLKSLKTEISKTSRIKFRRFQNLSNQITKLELELSDLNQQLADQKEAEVIREGVSVSPGHEVVEDVLETVDENNNLVISGSTPFLSLPQDLQIELAEIYLLNKDTSDTEDFGNLPETNVDGTGALKANADFDAGNVGINPVSKINELSEEDVAEIQANMQSHIRYIDAIADYNNNALTQKVTPIVQEVEEETPEKITTVSLSLSDMVALFPGIDTALSESKIKNRLGKLNSAKSQKDFGKVMESLIREIAKINSKKESAELDESAQEEFDAKVENWKDNQKAINNNSFVFAGESFSIPKADIPFFLQQHPKIRTVHPDEFMKAAFEYKKNSENYARAYKTNPPAVSVNDIEQLQGVVTNLFSQGIASSKVVAALNSWLRDSGSPYTIKRSKKGLSTLTYAVVERKATYTKPKSKSETLTQELGSWFATDDGYIYRATQAEYMVYQFLQNNKVNPSALPVDEKRSYTSSTSKFVSADGIADAIFDGMQQEQIERLGEEARNIVEDMLMNYSTVASIRAYLTNQMEYEKSLEDREMQYDDMQMDLEDIQSELDALAEYYSSPAYLIANNAFDGDINSLSTEEQNLYALMQAIKAGKSKQIEKRAAELNKELSPKTFNNFQYNYTGNVVTALKTADVSLKDTIALYSLANNTLNQLTESQRNLITSTAVERILSGNFSNHVINTPEGVMRIISTTGNVVALQRLENGKVTTMNVHELAGTTTAVLEFGTEFDPSGFDNKLDAENAKELSTAFGEIFGNFTESMNEFSSMNETTLMNSIVEELNKCK